MAAITLNPKPKGLHGIGGGQFGVGVLGRAPRARAWISTRLRSPSKIKPKSGSLALSFGGKRIVHGLFLRVHILRSSIQKKYDTVCRRDLRVRRLVS